MKNTLLMILLFAISGMYAQNNRCNFTLDIQGDFVQDSTYKMESVSIAGIKRNKHKSILTQIDFSGDNNLTLNLAYFQEILGAVCQYKGDEISKVMINGSNNKIQLLLVYKKIVPAGKSKN